MRKCTIGMFSRVVTLLVFGFVFAPAMGVSVYFAFLAPRTPGKERLIFLFGVLLCGGLLALAVYRVFYLGLIWVEYDAETVVFHYSRKELYRFRWEELPGAQVQVRREGAGYLFSIRQAGRQRSIPINRLSRGYGDFERELTRAGVLERAAILTEEQFKQSLEWTWEQLRRYREAYPDSVQPKPEGDSNICPDCLGKGLRMKKLPLLRLNVGRVCQTCGGSGYLPK